MDIYIPQAMWVGNTTWITKGARLCRLCHREVESEEKCLGLDPLKRDPLKSVIDYPDE